MWKLLNKIFGWHYIVMMAGVANYSYILRVKRDASGRLYVMFTGDLQYLHDDGTVARGYTWEPLTWPQKTPSPKKGG
jgi:hypothetical protein